MGNSTSKMQDMQDLIAATRSGDVEAVRALIKSGADVNKFYSPCLIYDTPIGRAIADGDTEIVSLLIEAKHDVNIVDINSETPLYIASWMGHADIVSLLIEAGAEVDKATKSGIAPVYIASMSGHLNVVRLLLEAGADVNKSEKGGQTPLSVAICRGYTEIVRLMIVAGADLKYRDKHGMTYLDLAKRQKNNDIIELLKNLTSATTNSTSSTTSTSIASSTDEITSSQADNYRSSEAEGDDDDDSRRATAIDDTGRGPHAAFIPYVDIVINSTHGDEGYEVETSTWEGRPVSIYLLHVVKLAQDAQKQLFDEITACGQLHSPFVIEYMGVSVDTSGTYTLVTELLPKITLYDVLSHNKDLTAYIKLQIAIDITEGLFAIHKADLLHRDLRSEHILLSDSMRVKIGGFGFLKAGLFREYLQGEAQSDAQEGMAWMAPELFSNNWEYSKASDVYSYGMVLWELASGKCPYEDKGSTAEIVQAIRSGEKETIPDDLPQSYARLIKRCWEDENTRITIAEARGHLRAGHEGFIDCNGGEGDDECFDGDEAHGAGSAAPGVEREWSF